MEVNKVVERLRNSYLTLSSHINERLSLEVFQQLDKINDHEQLNEKMLSIFFEEEIQNELKEYHHQYQRAAATFPGRILLSVALPLSH